MGFLLFSRAVVVYDDDNDDVNDCAGNTTTEMVEAVVVVMVVMVMTTMVMIMLMTITMMMMMKMTMTMTLMIKIDDDDDDGDGGNGDNDDNDGDVTSSQTSYKAHAKDPKQRDLRTFFTSRTFSPGTPKTPCPAGIDGVELVSRSSPRERSSPPAPSSTPATVVLDESDEDDDLTAVAGSARVCRAGWCLVTPNQLQGPGIFFSKHD